MINQLNKIQSAIKELQTIAPNCEISNPQKVYQVDKIPKDISAKLLIPEGVEISRRALKHILEQRGIETDKIISSLPKIVSNPTKVVDNSKTRLDSYLFIRVNGKARAAVLEVVKKRSKMQIVSAFLVNRRTYRKMVDISGRSDVPPSRTLKSEPAESEISVFQKTTTPIIARKNDKPLD